MVLACLEKENVDVVFGFPGGAVLTLYDEIYKMGKRHILTRHEQGAAHAADGYASYRQTGVVIATSGPGATNLVTGIATAYMDSVPLLVAITGQVATPLSNRCFQERRYHGYYLTDYKA